MEKRATSLSRKKTVTYAEYICTYHTIEPYFKLDLMRLRCIQLVTGELTRMPLSSAGLAWTAKDAALRNPKKPGTGFIDHSSDGKTQVRNTRRIKKARPRQYALHSPQKTAAPSEARVTTCVERRAS